MLGTMHMCVCPRARTRAPTRSLGFGGGGGGYGTRDDVSCDPRGRVPYTVWGLLVYGITIIFE